VVHSTLVWLVAVDDFVHSLAYWALFGSLEVLVDALATEFVTAIELFRLVHFYLVQAYHAVVVVCYGS
jgi:hypothetical protein